MTCKGVDYNILVLVKGELSENVCFKRGKDISTKKCKSGCTTEFVFSLPANLPDQILKVAAKKVIYDIYVNDYKF